MEFIHEYAASDRKYYDILAMCSYLEYLMWKAPQYTAEDMAYVAECVKSPWVPTDIRPYLNQLAVFLLAQPTTWSAEIQEPL